jgi:hypothetical protein
VLTGRRVVRVDPVKQEAVLHDGTVIRQDRVQSSAVANVASTVYTVLNYGSFLAVVSQQGISTYTIL